MKERVTSLIDSRIEEIGKELERRKSPSWISVRNDPMSGVNWTAVINELKAFKYKVSKLTSLEMEKKQN